MAQTATINLRIPASLKEHGGQVLERNGVSTTAAIHKMYEYLEREQKIPEWMSENAQDDKFKKRRRLAKSLGNMALMPDDGDDRLAYREHLLDKYH